MIPNLAQNPFVYTANVPPNDGNRRLRPSPDSAIGPELPSPSPNTPPKTPGHRAIFMTRCESVLIPLPDRDC